MANKTIIQGREENTDKSDNGDPTIMIVYSAPEKYDENVTIGFYDEDNELEQSFILNRTVPYCNFTKIATDT